MGHSYAMRIFILTLLSLLTVSLGISSSFIPHTSLQTIFGRSLTTESGLPDNNVRCICVDDDGFVWISTIHNLYRYDGYRFVPFYLIGSDSKSSRIERLVKVGHNLLQIRMPGGKYRILDTRTLKYNDTITENQGKSSLKLKKDHFFDSRGNIIRFDKATGEVNIPIFDNRDSLRLKVVNEDMSRLHNDYKIAVLRSSDSSIWVSTNGNGLFMYDRMTKNTHHINKSNYPSFFKSDYIVSMADGADGAVWVAFNRAGIARIEREKPAIRSISMNKDDPHNNSNEIKLLKKVSDGRIIAANDAGRIGEIDYLRNDVVHVDDFPDGLEYLDAGWLPSGKIWIATRNHGLMLDNHWHTNNNRDNSTIGGNRVDAVMADSNGRIWVAGTGFLDCIADSDVGKNDIRFLHLMDDYNHSNVRQLLLDKHGDIWGATDDGLIVYNPDSLLNPQGPSTNKTAIIKILEGIRINALHKDASGRVWIGTENAGLYYVDNWSSRIEPENLQKAEWYSSKAYIQSVASNANGNLWIGTDNGLLLYRPDHSSPSLLRFDNTSAKNIYQRGCVAEINDGTMAFGTSDGIVIVDENDFKSFNKPVNLHISDVVVNNRSLLSRLVVSEDGDVYNLKLDETERFITIYFTDLSFGNASRFSYKMEGMDSLWIPIDDKPFVAYSDLPSGHHTFRVRAISPDGDFMEKKVEIKVASSSSAAIKVIVAIFIMIVLLVAIFFLLRNRSKRTNEITEEYQTTGQLPELDTSEYDCEFIVALDKFIEEHMTESDLGVERMAKAMNYGRTKFYEKVNNLLGCSPKEYLRRRRMEKAVELLKDDRITVAEVAYSVGFGTPQYLTTVFKQMYGISPSRYRKQGGLMESENVKS